MYLQKSDNFKYLYLFSNIDSPYPPPHYVYCKSCLPILLTVLRYIQELLFTKSAILNISIYLPILIVICVVLVNNQYIYSIVVQSYKNKKIVNLDAQ